MSKLLSTYARATGLRISSKGPLVQKVFYPIPHEQYITIQTGSNQPAKNYDYYNDVISLIKPMLEANKIAILHLGGKEDPALENVIDLRGKTSILQSNYLVSKTLLHLGNDSWLAHVAGWQYRPLIALYGSTCTANHGPYWYDIEKTSLIEAHRWGGKPTFMMNEQPKSINTIDPFKVANEALRLLGINHTFASQTRFHGILYRHLVLELIPDGVPHPQFCAGVPLTVRMDYLHNEAILEQVLLNGRQVNIITAAPVNPQLLARFRGQILTYNHELGAGDTESALPPPEYVGSIKTVCPRHVFFTKESDPKKLAQIRFRYFDYCNGVEQLKDLTRDDYLAGALHYLNLKDTPENRLDLTTQLSYTRFRSTKYLLSKGSVFLSLAHLRLGKPIAALTNNVAPIIDDPAFWRELNHVSIFYDQPTG